MYGLISQIEAVPGKRDELASILISMGLMPGCLSYVVASDPTGPNEIWVTEVWETRRAHADSLALAEVQAAIAQGRPLIAEFRTRIETEPVGGIGLG